jgi:plastocyanin
MQQGEQTMTKLASVPARIADTPADRNGNKPMLTLARTLIARLKGRRLARSAPLRLLAAAPALALVVAACSGAVDGYPASTYAPPPSASALPGMNMSPDPGAATPPTAPSASAAPSAAGSTGATLHISARNIAFDTDHLQAPAGQPFVLEFDNNDPGIPHNVDIQDPNGVSLFRGQIINGPSTESYQIPALAAGVYRFACDVHPDMAGTLTVH